MIKSYILTGILTILFYLLLLYLFLIDVLDGLLYLMILLITLITLICMFFVSRKNRMKKRKIAIATTLIFVLFCYEIPLIGFYTQSHVAVVYVEPLETVKGAGIFFLSVGKVTKNNLENKKAVKDQLTKEQVDVLTITAITNRMRYENKNKTILQWLKLDGKSPKEEMRANLKQYFGNEEQRLTDFFNTDQAEGSSSGLSLLLTELMFRGELQNHLQIAVTGSINGDGDVSAIGALKEKIQIAEKADFQFMMIPSENAKEARQIQKELKTKVEIIDVDHVDEAVEQINNLNNKYK